MSKSFFPHKKRRRKNCLKDILHFQVDWMLKVEQMWETRNLLVWQLCNSTDQQRLPLSERCVKSCSEAPPTSPVFKEYCGRTPCLSRVLDPRRTEWCPHPLSLRPPPRPFYTPETPQPPHTYTPHTAVFWGSEMGTRNTAWAYPSNIWIIEFELWTVSWWNAAWSNHTIQD